MDVGAWIALAALLVAAGSLAATVLANRGMVRRSDLHDRDSARKGYVDEVKAELDLFRQKFAQADMHMKTCEEDLRQLRRDHNVLKAQNFALMQMMLPKVPLVLQPDGGE